MTGLAPLGNGGDGVLGSCGRADVRGNVISANGANGVRFARLTTDRVLGTVVGNFIGVNARGDAALGNLRDGVAAEAAMSVTVGNGAPSRPPTRPLVLGFQGGNVISGNGGGLGIDLSAGAPGGPGDGVTPNDPGDADQGPDGLQNFPLVRFATGGANGSRIGYSFDSAPGRDYVLHFYSNASADPGGHGEGQTLLVSVLSGLTRPATPRARRTPRGRPPACTSPRRRRC